jgi:hypothetical protein
MECHDGIMGNGIMGNGSKRSNAVKVFDLT